MKKGKTSNAKKRRLGSKSKTRSSTDKLLIIACSETEADIDFHRKDDYIQNDQYATATPPVLPDEEEVEEIEERIVRRKRRCHHHGEQEKAVTKVPAASYGRAGKVIASSDCFVNLGLQKIKLEQDYIPPQTKSEIKLEQDYIPPQTESEIKLEQDYIPPQTESESEINLEPLNASDKVVAELDNLETDTPVVQKTLTIEPEVMNLNELPSPEITSELLQFVFKYLEDIPSLRSCRLVDSVWKDAATQITNKRIHQAADLTKNDGLIKFLLQCPDPRSLPFNRFKMSLSDSSMSYTEFIRFFSKYGSCMKHLELSTDRNVLPRTQPPGSPDSGWDGACMAKLKMVLRHTSLESLIIKTKASNSRTQYMSVLSEEDQIAADASKLLALRLSHDLAESRDFINVVLTSFPETRALCLTSVYKKVNRQIPSFDIQKVRLTTLDLPNSYFRPATTFWPLAESQRLLSLSVCILTETQEDKRVYENFLASQADTLRLLSLDSANVVKDSALLVQLPPMRELRDLTFSSDNHSVHPIEREAIENVTDISLWDVWFDSIPLDSQAVFPKVTHLNIFMEPWCSSHNTEMDKADQIIQVGRWFPNLELLLNLDLHLTTNELRTVFAHLSCLQVLYATVTQAKEEEQEDINYVLSGFTRGSEWILDQLMVKGQTAVLSTIQPPEAGLHSMTNLRFLFLRFKSRTPDHFQIEALGVQMALLRIQPLQQGVILEGDFQLSSENVLKLTNYHSNVILKPTQSTD